jgi:hypothetical protein
MASRKVQRCHYNLPSLSDPRSSRLLLKGKGSGFGGLAVSIPGSNPAEAVGFFGQKIPQHAYLRRGSKAVCPMSQICGM